MILVERHFHKGNPQIVQLCGTAKDLYNKADFYLRQAWIQKQSLPGFSELVKLVENEPCYKNLHNTKTAKKLLMQLRTDWSNFFKSSIAYDKDPSKFIRRPKPPYYKEKMSQVFFDKETIRKKLIPKGILQPTNDIFHVKSQRKFKQVKITPKTFGFMIEVSYESPAANQKGSKKKKVHAGIALVDIGLNNLCTITSDQQTPILVNGRILKSFNQWFNKHPNSKYHSRKRYFRIENYFHHVSKKLIDFCLKNGLGRIIIGRNEGWKQGMRMGKKNNQAFQYIPFFLLLEKIKYKAEAAGVKVEFTEEAYTSKASFLDQDPLDGSKLSGTRVKRGLYKSKNGTFIHADVNGSLNIGRKILGNKIYTIFSHRSIAAMPVRVNPLQTSAW